MRIRNCFDFSASLHVTTQRSNVKHAQVVQFCAAVRQFPAKMLKENIRNDRCQAKHARKSETFREICKTKTKNWEGENLTLSNTRLTKNYGNSVDSTLCFELYLKSNTVLKHRG